MCNKGEIAKELFEKGYNCCQAVLLAYCKELGIDEETAAKLSSSFGGGMGGMGETCGAVTGMFMVAGVLYGYDDPKDYDKKTEHYARIQLLAKEFEALNGSIVCRDLLGLGTKKEGPAPDKRTDEYYKKRPCAELVGMAAAIMEQYILKNPTN